jgi:FAD/FMN-containing dehydrogenase/Fe-S oxidoreductase
MDPERKRIEEDLRGLIAGDVLCDDVNVQLYATDASIYEMVPLGVARPSNEADVVALVQYARDSGLPIHARGAGSGLAGESVGRGLIVDFSRYFRRILRVDDTSVRVQAGVVHGDLNRLLATHSRVFGPDPAMSDVTTMGGVVAIDAAGSHFALYGSTRQHVRSLRVVLTDGSVLDVGRHQVPEGAAEGDYTERLDQLVCDVASLIRRNQAVIDTSRINSPINRSGYPVGQVLREDQLDLAKLLVGSEGTLALITEIEVDTHPLPRHTGCALLVFESLDKAARAAEALLPHRPSVCDLMDRRHLSLAREMDLRYELLIPNAAEAVLMIEHVGESEQEVEELLARSVQTATVETGLAAAAQIAADTADKHLFGQLAKRFVPTLYRLQGVRRPIPFVEDIALPVRALPIFLRHLQDVLKRQQAIASVFGHVGHGQLHIRPFLDLGNPQEVRRMESLASELYEKVWLLGGTISGEHGDGYSRTPFLSRQYGQVVNVFRELKKVFDPQGLLNPGKVVPLPGARMTHSLRQVRPAPPWVSAELSDSDSLPIADQRPVKSMDLALDWNGEEITWAARLCNGCGACRTRALPSRMCPMNRIGPREEASPRAKANMMRAVLTGQLPSDAMQQDPFKQVADLCFHCHMCRIECPANADIPKLMMEAKAQYVDSNGLTLQDWLLVRIDAVSGWAGRFPHLTNRLMRNRQVRWLLQRFMGISQARPLPRLAKRPFLSTVSRRGLDSPARDEGLRVALLVDTYANRFDTALPELLLRILEHNGVSVYVPSTQLEAGMPMISQGALEPARRIAHRNVQILAEAIRRGYSVISTEPSAVLALTREYPALLKNDEDARLVADNTQEACHYLWQLHQLGGLQLDFQPLECEIAHHVPCHLKALEIGTPSENLLRLVPGLSLHRVEKGCSGMAGLWGMKQENYRSSIRIGMPLMSEVRDGPYHFAITECSACSLQISEGSNKPTVHPLQVIAAAYGLAPPPIYPFARKEDS